MTTMTSKLWTPTPDVIRVGQTPDLEMILYDLMGQVEDKMRTDGIVWCGKCQMPHRRHYHTEHPAEHGFLLGMARSLADLYDVPVILGDLGETLGMTDRSSIVLNHRQGDGSKAHVLLHELTHVVAGDWSRPTSRLAQDDMMIREELLAEATGYVTATALGLTTPFSAGYIAGYCPSGNDFSTKRYDILATSARFVKEMESIVRQEAMVAA